MTLKVIGAGFGRTGTASLKIALERLLDTRCYHMSEVLGNPGHVDLWLDVAAGRPDWPAIFENYAATVDFPASNYWKELADAFPEAKVILSLRDAGKWFRSTQKTIFSNELQGIYEGTKWGGMVTATIDDRLGGDINDEAAMIAAFEAHTANVTSAFGPDRLLIYRAGDGWAPLCKFLDVPEPDEDYPHINSKEEFENVLGLLNSPIGAKAMNGEGIDTGTAHEDLFEND